MSRSNNNWIWVVVLCLMHLTPRPEVGRADGPFISQLVPNDQAVFGGRPQVVSSVWKNSSTISHPIRIEGALWIGQGNILTPVDFRMAGTNVTLASGEERVITQTVRFPTVNRISAGVARWTPDRWDATQVQRFHVVPTNLLASLPEVDLGRVGDELRARLLSAGIRASERPGRALWRLGREFQPTESITGKGRPRLTVWLPPSTELAASLSEQQAADEGGIEMSIRRKIIDGVGVDASMTLRFYHVVQFSLSQYSLESE